PDLPRAGGGVAERRGDALRRRPLRASAAADQPRHVAAVARARRELGTAERDYGTRQKRGPHRTEAAVRKVRPMPDFEPLIDVLAALPHQDGLFNPYASTALLPTPTAYDEVGEEADAIRRSNLKRYLENVTAAGADV